MSLLAGIQAKAANVVVQEKDVLGGGNYTAPTGIHPATIKLAYLDKAQNSASTYVVIEYTVHTEGGDKTFKDTTWISNREGGVTYVDKKTNEEMPLPGYQMIDTLCKLATGAGLAQQQTDVKMVKLYNREAKGEVPQPKEVIMSLLGKKVCLGLLEVEANKTQYDKATDTTTLLPETRVFNELNKVFDANTKQTIGEKLAGTEAAFATAWAEKFNTRINRVKEVKAAPSGMQAGGVMGAGNPASLF